MSMNSPQESIKDVARDIWKDKPLMIAIVIVLVGVAYWAYQRNKTAGITAPTAAAPNGPLSPGGSFYNTYQTFNSPPPVPSVAPPVGPPVPAGFTPGATFLGPTGVKHYVATGNQTLSQIASAFALGTWNAIYAIPDNQRIFGRLNATAAAAYVPVDGTYITLPPNTTIGF